MRSTLPPVTRATRTGVLLLATVSSSCSGIQSALDPAGADAGRAATLFLWMAAGAVVIWAAVLLLAFFAPRLRAPEPGRQRHLFIVGAGVLFPIAVLTPLLAYGLAAIPPMLAPGEPGLRLEVTGQQWWWRVRYVTPGRAPIALANELRLPVGRRVTVRVATADVIHSFWVPALAGKMDMIPGRLNEIALEPTRIGTFRGACAEFCGTSHARMNFAVVVMPADEFEAWLEVQARDAAPPDDPVAQRGQTLFFSYGCNTCHTVRGTLAAGRVGPDLTHVGSRVTLAAGQFPNDREHLMRWIQQTELLKPGVHMPAFARMPADDLTALAAFLQGLR